MLVSHRPTNLTKESFFAANGEQEQKGVDGLSKILLWFFLGEGRGNITREGGRERTSALPWDNQFWPNGLNWVSIFQSSEGSEQLIRGGVLGWLEVTALWAVYQTQQLSSFLITSAIISLGDTAEVLCLGSTSQWEVWALHSDPTQTRKRSVWIVCFWASQPFLLYLKEKEEHLGIRVLGAKGSLQEFGSEDCCTRCSFESTSKRAAGRTQQSELHNLSSGGMSCAYITCGQAAVPALWKQSWLQLLRQGLPFPS